MHYLPMHPDNGRIVERTLCEPPLATYEQYVEQARRRQSEEEAAARREGFPADRVLREVPLLSESEFMERIEDDRFECFRLKYRSEGLNVAGFLWKPRETRGRTFPLILFNRGGNRELSKLTPWYRFGFHHFLSSGFVVMASQYRGSDGGEGKDELGGNDVKDVINLLAAARNFDYVDPLNVFMLGESRGGMMTYLALKRGLKANAAAVIGGMADLVADARARPGLLDVAHRQLIPDFDARPEEHMRERSAVYWPERLDAPLLLMHGAADWRVDPATQTLALALKLQQLKKTYELVIYAGDDHLLTLNREDSDRRIVQWFRRFMQ